MTCPSTSDVEKTQLWGNKVNLVLKFNFVPQSCVEIMFLICFQAELNNQMHWQELLEIMLKLDRLSLKNRIYCHWKVAKRKKKHESKQHCFGLYTNCKSKENFACLGKQQNWKEIDVTCLRCLVFFFGFSSKSPSKPTHYNPDQQQLLNSIFT